MGPRRERLAHPRVKLLLGQLVLDERGLEYLDCLLAVGSRRTKLPATRGLCRYLVSRHFHHGISPTSAMQGSLTPLRSADHPRGG
jgi:hypothetical protein